MPPLLSCMAFASVPVPAGLTLIWIGMPSSAAACAIRSKVTWLTFGPRVTLGPLPRSSWP